MSKFLLLIICLIACFCIYASNDLPLAENEELEIILEFPIEVDSLDEFIQSYYELLDSDTYLKQFKFLAQEQNIISNPQAIEGFFAKLMQLRNGNKEPVSILQIGDSHIKPGYFSTTVRGSLLNFFQAGLTVDSAILKYQYIGINGASFYNLTENEQVFETIKTQQPQLIIISLGTNDAQGNYDAQRFKQQLVSFMEKLYLQMPKPTILFTLPADSYKKSRHNADVKKVCNELKSYAQEHGFAWWDLYEVMGGYKSMDKWQANSLASKDKVHFSPKGYMLQGYLFYQALLRGYQNTVGGAW